MAEGERIQKTLARAGVASRRAAEELVRAGRVSIDGVRAELGQRVPPGAEVRVDGRAVAQPSSHRTFMLHKPRGVITTAKDERGRATALELLPDVPGLHTVGRLDRDSEGLLLATTDGELTLRLTHPRYGHTKTYRVWCAEGTLARETLAALRRGVTLDDGPARVLGARPAEGGAALTLAEGRKHQVRRMLAAVGHEVVRLVRTHVGGLPLGDLAPGAWRELTERDVERLGYTPPSGHAAPTSGAPPSPLR
jgi:23S rRNA pseudouridine2605 synthase